MGKLISTNPAKDYEIVGEVDASTNDEIEEKVALANKAKLRWKEIGVKKRIELLKPIYEEFKARQNEIATLITKEMGKPINKSKLEVKEALTEEFKWFLENGAKALEDEVTFEDEKSLHKIVFEPIGTVAVITPWNFPFEMFVWGGIANLVAGNTVVFKISEECPLIGKIIEDVMSKGSLPEGIFSEVYGAGEVGQTLAESKVDLIWFTGSSKVGKKLYKIAAEKFIKVLLEMGGSNPGIVFEDADLERFAAKIYSKRFSNCGQTCDALKRLIVQKPIFEKTVKLLKKEAEKTVVGNPMDEKTTMGSLVAKRQLELLEEQVKDAVEKGAKMEIGGKRPDKLKGAFFEPTILTNVSRQMRVWKEEVFGPVLSMVPFETEEEAIELANDTEYGLGATVFTEDKEKGKRVASRIEAGTVEINEPSHWLMCNPFGGYKSSGIGREHGIYGMRQLTQVKVISAEK